MRVFAHGLTGKFLFTIFALVVYRFGSFIPVPGVDSSILTKIAGDADGGVLGIFNVLSGGALGRMSIFSLAIMPYITASILVQLMVVLYKPLADMKKDGESGSRKITQISRCLTVFFSALQSYGIAAGLSSVSSKYGGVTFLSLKLFYLSTVVTMVVGTLLLVWLGEQISAIGIGSGSSIIIFVGIVSALPGGVISIFDLSRRGVLSFFSVAVILAVIFLLLFFVVFFETAQRNIQIFYPGHRGASRSTKSSYIPVKLNASGVIPPIFASSVLLFPATISTFVGDGGGAMVSFIARYIGHGKPLFIAFYVVLIFVFSFMYSSVVFPCDETAENLKKSGAYILGKRPGKNTSDYIRFVLNRLTFVGSLYLVVICVVPEFFMQRYFVSFSLGGTSLLIVVNVVIDTFIKVRTYLFGSRYDYLLKKTKFLY